jgi:hypothetical protein
MSLVESFKAEIEQYGKIKSIWINPDLIEQLGREAPDKVMDWFPTGERTYDNIPLIPMDSVSKWVLIFDKTEQEGEHDDA